MEEKEITKVCFKCGRELPLGDFYKHSKMSDGHLNKCKECAKNDAKSDYDRKVKDELWAEKERARGREKYRRLNYKEKEWEGKTKRDFNLPSNVSRRLKNLGYETGGKEAHHWNYNKPKSIMLLSRKAHHRIHKYIYASREDKFCYTLDGRCLDTEEKTIEYYRGIFSKYDDLDENLEIINLT